MQVETSEGAPRVAPPHLYRIAEFPELFADACLRNSEGDLKFLSFYGRDGSVKQFLAALELGAGKGGVSRFYLVGKDDKRHRVEAGSASNLSMYSGRLRQNLFGPLSQTWLYDGTFAQADRANRIGWLLHRAAPGEDQDQVHQILADKAWALTCQLAPVALLDTWRQPIQDWCRQTKSYEHLDDPLYPPLGGIHALRVSVTDHLLRFVSAGVKSGQLPV